LLVATLGAPSVAYAADKRECIRASDDGQALRLDGKLLDARERFLVCADRSCPGVVQSACAEWLSGVEAQIPSVLPTLRDAEGHDVVGAVVTIDQRTPTAIDGRPISLDPGPHVLTAKAPDGRQASQSVILREGEQRRAIDLTLARADGGPPPKALGRPTPWAAIAVTSVAGVAWATFAGFGIAGHLEYRDLEETCAPNCSAAQVAPIDTKFWVADVALGLAIVATVVATVLFLVAPKAKPPTASLVWGASF
jgi:hypothetical protein